MAEYPENWAISVRLRCLDMTDADLKRLWLCEQRLADLKAAFPEVDAYIRKMGKSAERDKTLWNNMLKVAEDDVFWAGRRYRSDRDARRYSV